MSPPMFSSLGDLRARLDAAEVSSVELTRNALSVLESEGRRHHLVAALAAERAHKEASQADARIQAGDQTSLTGIPYGVKDQLATVGTPTSWGSAIYKDQRFEYDATVVKRLQQAGAVMVAKLSMMELGGAGGYRSAGASASGPAGNPWNGEHWAGGSSGGSAAAVGAGFVPFALAGDSLGSIILPAALCGVTGLRPTYGALSRYGSMPGSWSFGKVGVIARSAAECAEVFRVVAGADPNDPNSVDGSYEKPDGRQYRVGTLSSGEHLPESLEALMEAACDVLRRLGMALSEVGAPDRGYADLAKRIRAGDVVAAHEHIIRDPDQLAKVLDQRQREGLMAFLEEPLGSYARAIQERVYVRREIMSLFDSVDLLLTISVPQEAPSLNADLMNQPFRQSIHTAMGALADLPGVSIPIGFGDEGLPVGITLIGRPFADMLVLDAARQYQGATDWHLRIPPRRTRTKQGDVREASLLD